MNTIKTDIIPYSEVHEQLPLLLEKLLGADKHLLSELTKGKIEKLIGTKSAVPGVYLMSQIDDDMPVYVGRSKNLAQRIGTDHRAIQKTQATLAQRLWKQGLMGFPA